MKMKPKMWFVLLVDVLLLGVLFFASSTDWLFTEQKQISYKISILMEDTDISSDDFIAGVQEGAIEKNVDVHILQFSADQTIEEKQESLQKQLEKGTQGLVLCLHGDTEIETLLADVPPSIPVVSWGMELQTENVYANVGYDVLEEVELLCDAWQSTNKREAAYVTLGNETPENLAFYETLRGVAEEKGFVLEEIQLAELSGAKTFIQGMAIEGRRILVSTDTALLAELGAASNDLHLQIPLYGIGYGDGIRSALEIGAIDGVVVHREFEGGYIALCQTVNALQQKASPKEAIIVESALVTKENMYGTVEETIIFPYK